MFRTRIVCLLAAACLLLPASTAFALEVDCDCAYCFTTEDFSLKEEPLEGICITSLPEPSTGTVTLGSRVLQPGDILTADQLGAMTFIPLQTETDRDAVVTYLPIYADRVESTAVMTIAIRGKENKAPIAEDSALETYKNLPIEGRLKVTEPEGEAMTFTIVRQGKRGQAIIDDNGNFTYTPKKNKVGVDSFVYTVTDAQGNVSREATVTITILKPTGAPEYSDTQGHSCRFTAEWMKNTGIFVGEQLDGRTCFQPEKTVSRGEFLTMLVKALEIDVDETITTTGFTDECPDWLRPYLSAALRSGLISNWPDAEVFGADKPITGAEAALLLQNALDLANLQTETPVYSDTVPVWAQDALTTLAGHGLVLSSETELTRAQTGQLLYQASLLAREAPGMIPMQ